MNSQRNITDRDHVAVYLSLGANEPSSAGSEQQTLLAAIPHLQQLSMQPVLLSSLYTSDPVDCAPGTKNFINAAARLRVPAAQAPLDLLFKLQDIERLFGRKRGPVLNASRPLDIDVICYGNVTMASDRLTLPHPRARQRLFVLVPLAELCDELELGGDTRNLDALIRQLPASPGVIKL